MLENNEQGKAARRYFIEVERRAREEFPKLLLQLQAQVNALQTKLLATTTTAPAQHRRAAVGGGGIKKGKALAFKYTPLNNHLVRTVLIGGQAWYCIRDIRVAYGVKTDTIGSYKHKQYVMQLEVPGTHIAVYCVNEYGMEVLTSRMRAHNNAKPGIVKWQ